MNTQDEAFDPASDLLHADTAGKNLHAEYPNIFPTESQASWFVRKRDVSGWGDCFSKIGKRVMLSKPAFAAKLASDKREGVAA